MLAVLSAGQPTSQSRGRRLGWLASGAREWGRAGVFVRSGQRFGTSRSATIGCRKLRNIWPAARSAERPPHGGRGRGLGRPALWPGSCQARGSWLELGGLVGWVAGRWECPAVVGWSLCITSGSGFRRALGLRAKFCLGVEWVVHVCSGNINVCIETQRHDKRTPTMHCELIQRGMRPSKTRIAVCYDENI